jgi:hypothetical protein
MPPHAHTDGNPAQGRPGPQVVGLIDRIKRLVSEQRRLDEDDRDERRRDANRREVARLKWRLANAVKRELSPGPAPPRGRRQALACRVQRGPETVEVGRSEHHAVARRDVDEVQVDSGP